MSIPILITVIYFMTANETPFVQIIQLSQYKEALATTGTVPGTSTIKLYIELGLKNLSESH